MSSLPYFDSSQTIVNQCCYICTPCNVPGYTAQNLVLSVPQLMTKVGQIGTLSLLNATGFVGGNKMSLVGFVLPPLSQVVADISGLVSATISNSPDKADLWSSLSGLAGPIVGSHSGTSGDPITVPNWYPFGVDQGGDYAQPSSHMGRAGTNNPPIFTSRYDLKNVRFINGSDSLSWFISPGNTYRDFDPTDTVSVYHSLMNIGLYKAAQYVSDLISTEISPLVHSNGPLSNALSSFKIGL